MKYKRGSEWRQWDLHLHTPSSYLYAMCSIDYFRSMSDEDRRYLIFNPNQKMKVTTQGGDVIRLIMNVVCNT